MTRRLRSSVGKGQGAEGTVFFIGMYKKSAYRERSKSSPNLMNMNPSTKSISVDNSNKLQRSHSSPLNINKTKSVNGPPQSGVQHNRDRRMSEPFTEKEKVVAVALHNEDDEERHSDFNSNEDSLCPECKSGKLVLADGKYTCGVCGLIKDE